MNLASANETLVYAISVEVDQLDPGSTSISRQVDNIFEGLVKFKAGTTSIEPCLATSWEISADGKEITFYYLSRRFYSGAVIKSTKLTREFDYEAFRNHYGEEAIPLFCITDENKLIIITTDQEFEFRPGMTLISLVDDK